MIRREGCEKRNVSEAAKKRVAALQRWNCAACCELLDATFEVDHVVALWRGGSNDASNLQALCPRCHREKTFVERTNHQTEILQNKQKLKKCNDVLMCFDSEQSGSRTPMCLVVHILKTEMNWQEPYAECKKFISNEFGWTVMKNVLFPRMFWVPVFVSLGVPYCLPEDKDDAVCGVAIRVRTVPENLPNWPISLGPLFASGLMRRVYMRVRFLSKRCSLWQTVLRTQGRLELLCARCTIPFIRVSSPQAGSCRLLAVVLGILVGKAYEKALPRPLLRA